MRVTSKVSEAASESTGCPEDVPAGLRYVSDASPGISRRRERDAFVYRTASGERIDDPGVIARINALAIPPAYEDVWICPNPRGHLQATGRDARGRKQYRYHARWREARDENKFERMLAFGGVLPRLRARVARDLRRRGMPREKVLATVVRLLDTTLIRIGNEDYARENQSYGLTTLRNRHVEVRGATMRFHFRGKSGVEHDVTLADRRLAAIVRRCMDLPGQELFQYIDADGTRRAVDSSDINAYLREITGGEFTAKDFRTWAGSVHAMAALRALPEETGETLTAMRRSVADVVKTVARRLGNTPAVCRRCYVHPAVFEAYEAGALAALQVPAETTRRRGLRNDEAMLAAFLKQWLKQQARESRRAARTKRRGVANAAEAGLVDLLRKSRREARGASSGKTSNASNASSAARPPKASRTPGAAEAPTASKGSAAAKVAKSGKGPRAGASARRPAAATEKRVSRRALGEADKASV
ncbi:DNA topoisomerase IB [Chitinasiproducens palmae]|uniref:DNA topoisomerase n=1 Tax=Chitinasiproducens palmae TaxID=1770053 RepID=A0A1H2PNA5_9BURK|nr:DNA topoisomerase IB [Chitinasiproducens palmae]SDV47648.1 DNA topoisomerase-1 [Chitinasiproducens palmae]